MKIAKTSPLKFETTNDYLQAFLKTQEQKVRNFSHRPFAKQIGWPVSYLLDVTKGRKRLTINRAYQLAQAQNLTPLEAEHLMYLVIQDDLPEMGRNTHKRKVAQDYKAYSKHTNDINFESFNAEYAAILSLLRWSGRLLDEETIVKLLPTFNLKKGDVTRALDFLSEQEIIKINSDKSLEFLKDPAQNEFEIGGAKSFKSHIEHAENLLRFTQNVQKPWMANSAILELSISEMSSIFKKSLEFCEWIYELAKETEVRAKEQGEKTLLFQFNLHLLNILNRDLAEALQEKK